MPRRKLPSLRAPAIHSTVKSTVAKQVGTGFTTIAARSAISMALKADGSLWAWGRNNYGQFGDGTTKSRSTPAQVATGISMVALGEMHATAFMADGSVWAWGSNWTGQLGNGTLAESFQPQLVNETVDDFLEEGRLPGRVPALPSMCQRLKSRP